MSTRPRSSAPTPSDPEPHVRIQLVGGGRVILDAAQMTLAQVGVALETAIAGAEDGGHVSGWTDDGTWTIVPGRSIHAAVVLGFDRHADTT